MKMTKKQATRTTIVLGVLLVVAVIAVVLTINHVSGNWVLIAK